MRWLIGFLPSGIPAAMLAQSSDPLSGGAGWVGAGLLGLVLGWLLLKHLPDKDRRDKEKDEAKDKQLKELIDAKDAQITAMWARHREQLGEFVADATRAEAARREEYRASLQLIIDHCQSNVAAIVKGIEHLTAELKHRPGDHP